MKLKLVDKLFGASNMIVILWALDGTIVYINKYTEVKTGFTLDEISGKSLYDFLEASNMHEKNPGSNIYTDIKIGNFIKTVLKCKTGDSIRTLFYSSVFYDSQESEYVLSLGEEITKKDTKSETAVSISAFNKLTKLPNRSLFKKMINDYIARSGPKYEKSAVLLIDVDNLIDMNNAFGYKFGDTLLKSIAEILSVCFHRGEIISHYEGDCFALFIPDLADIENAVRIAKRLNKLFRMPWQFGNHDCYSTVSIGITIYPDDGATAEILVKNADTALYCAKRNGKDRYQLYSKTIDVQITQKLNIEFGLRRAVENKEFTVYYQPQVDTSTGKIISLEALVRWVHPTEGIIPPSVFIPVADETGLINLIGEYVLNTACEQLGIINRKFNSRISMAVNLSPCQFKDSNLSFKILGIVEKANIDPGLLEIEITEEAAIKDINTTIRLLEELGSRNIKIALDDFCTGYSSLCYLELLPINKIKIDKSFIDGITESYKKNSIVDALIGLAHRLGISIVAEGVEDKQQYDALQYKNCDILQGYYLSKPLPFDELVRFMEQRDLKAAPAWYYSN